MLADTSSFEKLNGEITYSKNPLSSLNLLVKGRDVRWAANPLLEPY